MNEYTYKATVTFTSGKSSDGAAYHPAKVFSKQNNYEHSLVANVHYFIKSGTKILLYPNNTIEVAVKTKENLSSALEDVLKLSKALSLKDINMVPTFVGLTEEEGSALKTTYLQKHEEHFPPAKETKEVMDEFDAGIIARTHVDVSVANEPPTKNPVELFRRWKANKADQQLRQKFTALERGWTEIGVKIPNPLDPNTPLLSENPDSLEDFNTLNRASPQAKK